jgi:adenosine deaminase
LWTGLVPPDGLRFHIRESIERGGAKRIGHGVDVMFEDDAAGLLKEMAAKKVAVEINLSSNDMILGVRGDDHPLPIYLKAGVPVAISTDDEGVARSDITQEYWRAVRTYPISYPELKQIVRNSLEYSFLKGDSLWSDGAYNKRAAACATVGARCHQFLKTSEKARLQWKLEQDFTKFESGECCKIAAPQAPKH